MKNPFLLLLFLPFCIQAQSITTIYGLSRNFNPAQVYLASMQPGTGIVTEISTAPVSQSYGLNPLSAIDPVNDKFYYGLGAGVILSVDLITGLADTILLNLPVGDDFDLMQYNCSDSTLYGLYRMNIPAGLFLSKVNVNTGQFTVISPLPVGVSYSLNAKSTLDPANNLFYFIAGVNTGVNLVAVDLTTGLIVQQTNITFSGLGQFFDMMTYNCVNGIIYGISRTSSPAALYPATINPTTGVVTTLSTTSMGQAILLNGMSEINPFLNVFHFFNGSFQSYDLITGNILPTPALSFSTPPGNVYFDMIARDNCKCIFANPSSSSQELNFPQVNVYPNPIKQGESIHLSLAAQNKDRMLYIYDITGSLVYQQLLSSQENNIQINTIQFTAGYYQLSIDGMKPTKLMITQ